MRSDVGGGAARLVESLEMRQSLADKGGIAQCLESMAVLAGARHQPTRAATLLGVAASLRESMGSQLSPAERMVYERDLGRLKAEIDPDAFAAAWAEGRAMTVEQSIAYALENAADPA